MVVVASPSPSSTVLSNAYLCVQRRVVRHAVVATIPSWAERRIAEGWAVAAFALTFVAVNEHARVRSSVVIWVNKGMFAVHRIVGVATAAPAAKGTVLLLRPPSAVIAARHTANAGSSGRRKFGACVYRQGCAKLAGVGMRECRDPCVCERCVCERTSLRLRSVWL
mmetsp:Transcript_108204/g.209465  ORF Transcript_108204/g.209465 Transcript_108204/m.209465 type:complete len:166 (+) Transcript_108204:3-500(+)